jgi:phage shock protein PspC (stress-responsive transcriptional regulator)
MRPLRLARIAAEAEGVRLRHQAQRTVVRFVFAMIALISLAGTLTFLHVAAWSWLRQSWERQNAALILAGADFVLALLLALLAMRSSPDRVELEALAVRQRALEGATAGVAWSALAVQVLRLAGNLLSRSRR